MESRYVPGSYDGKASVVGSKRDDRRGLWSFRKETAGRAESEREVR